MPSRPPHRAPPVVWSTGAPPPGGGAQPKRAGLPASPPAKTAGQRSLNGFATPRLDTTGRSNGAAVARHLPAAAGTRPGAVPPPPPAQLQPFRRNPFGAAVAQRSVALAAPSTSSLASTTQDQAGQIYGIWRNEQYPAKVQDSSLAKNKCVYIGKTARGEDLGGRFVEHTANDRTCPWSTAKGCDYSNADDDKWPYVPRNVWKFNGITLFDVAAAEQFFLQDYLAGGAKLLNVHNALTPAKFAELKDTDAFSTKKSYPSTWKPVDIKTI